MSHVFEFWWPQHCFKILLLFLWQYWWLLKYSFYPAAGTKPRGNFSYQLGHKMPKLEIQFKSRRNWRILQQERHCAAVSFSTNGTQGNLMATAAVWRLLLPTKARHQRRRATRSFNSSVLHFPTLATRYFSNSVLHFPSLATKPCCRATLVFIRYAVFQQSATLFLIGNKMFPQLLLQLKTPQQTSSDHLM